MTDTPAERELAALKAKLRPLIEAWKQTSRGEWIGGHFADADHPCPCRSIVNEGYAGGLFTVHIDNGIASIEDGGNDCPPLEEAAANQAFVLLAANTLADPELVEMVGE